MYILSIPACFLIAWLIARKAYHISEGNRIRWGIVVVWCISIYWSLACIVFGFTFSGKENSALIVLLIGFLGIVAIGFSVFFVYRKYDENGSNSKISINGCLFPKAVIDTLYDMTDERLSDLAFESKSLAKKMLDKINYVRSTKDYEATKKLKDELYDHQVKDSIYGFIYYLENKITKSNEIEGESNEIAQELSLYIRMKKKAVASYEELLKK